MPIEVRTRQEPGGWVAVVVGEDGLGLALARHEDEDVAGDLALGRAARGRGLATFIDPRLPDPSDVSYADYLGWHGLAGPGLGFTVEELVRPGSPRHLDPPRTRWGSMVPALALAHELRRRALEAGARGLAVHAAFRRAGGAPDSRHKYNAALDLDLLPGDERFGGAYLRLGARIFAEYGVRLQLGLGSYHAAGTAWTRRLHLDAGTRSSPRAWQLSGGDYITPSAIDRIASIVSV